MASNVALQIPQTRLFRGFNTVGTEYTHDWTLFDLQLVKQDLSNHFNTRIGERVMRPTFGCSIWDYLDEPLTEANKQAIVAEALRVCNFDSRVKVVDAQVVAFENGLRVQLTLEYVPFAVVDTFTVDFENRQSLLQGNAA